ncbi:hypothetical protein HOG21_01985 [bacterium]|nr:hypothetical protein [bacterium]
MYLYVVGIAIFFDNPFFIKSSILSSISVFISFVISSFTKSITVIRYGIKSAFTSDQVPLYLHALFTSFLKSQSVHLEKDSINFFADFFIICLV